MSRAPHSPLKYDYHSHRPLTTLFWEIDRPWWFYLLLVGVFLVKHLPAFAMPLAMMHVLNTLETESRLVLLEPWFAIGMVLILLQNIVTNTIFIHLVSTAARRVESRLRAAIARRLQQLSISFHDNAESGRLQAKMLRDVEMVAGLCRTLMHSVLFVGFTLAYAITTTALKDPVMLLFFVIVIPVAIILKRIFQRPMASRQKDFRSGVEAMSARAAEMVAMIPVTRAHGVEKTEIRSFDSHLRTVSRRGLRLDRIHAFFGGAVWVFLQIMRLLCLGFTGHQYLQGSLMLGDVVLYNTFFQMILGATEGLLGLMPAITQGFDSMRSIGEVLECPDIEHNEGKDPVEKVGGRLSFEDVTFVYPDSAEAAVRDFSLEVPEGECVAFVGESGSGKTTLMHLALGFVRPTVGHIRIDNDDMESLDLRTYRNFVAVVPQDVILFAGTIRDNILYGLEQGVGEDRLREVIEAANAAEFLDRLPEGLETTIGERGAKLSGGQQQRIAVARALIRDPRVIILDEATSALDVVSEALVQEAVERLVVGRTTLIVAHRLSTVRKADRIVVMKGGKCIEVGPPTELLGRKGEFHKLHSMQQMLV